MSRYRLSASQAVAVLVIMTLSGAAIAGNVDLSPDGTTTWKAGVDGVEIQWGEDGNVKRLISRYSAPVEFPDRRGVAKAQVIAEEKAKGGIVRFLNQSVSSTRVVSEIQTDINRATQLRRTGATPNVQKSDERTLIESLTEVTTSFAKGELKGVVVLEKGYDEKLEEAWAVVGISEKTIEATRGVNRMLSGTSKKQDGSETGDGLNRQDSESRETKQKKW